MPTIPVKNTARGTVDLEGGRVLAPGDVGDAPDTPTTRALIDAGQIVQMPDAKPKPRGGDA